MGGGRWAVSQKRKMIRKIRANYLDGIRVRYKTNLQIPDCLDTYKKLNQIFQPRRISLVFRQFAQSRSQSSRCLQFLGHAMG